MSAREDILAYLAGRVATVAGITVYRSRQAAIARAEGTVLVLEPEEETVTKQGDGIATRDLAVRFQLVVRSDTPDTSADPILQAIHATFMSDITLGDRAASCIEQNTRWNFDATDQVALVAEVRYLVRYLTPVGSVAARA